MVNEASLIYKNIVLFVNNDKYNKRHPIDVEEFPLNPPEKVKSLLSSTVGTVLKTDVATLESDDTADQAINQMKERNQRCILVSSKGEIVGIVSETDLIYKVGSEGKNPSRVRLREIMTSPVVAIGPQTTVEEAFSIMKKHNVSQVMVHAYSAVMGLVYREDIYKMMKK
jgi:CBS domain-containing protein